MGSSHAPDTDVEDPVIPLPTPNEDALRLLKAALTVVVGDEQLLDDQEDLAHKTMAQIRLYSHLGQDSLTSGDRPGG
jgi:hypothetical protein